MYLANDDASVAVYSAQNLMFVSDKAPLPTTPEYSKVEEKSTSIAYWGLNNRFPDDVIAMIEKNPDLGAGLDFKARALIGNGIGYQVLNKETQIWEDRFIPEVNKFLKRNRKYPIQAATDFYRYFNAFPELVLTKDRSEVYYISSVEANFCRFELQNEETRTIDNVYVSSEWGKYPTFYREPTRFVDIIPALYPDGDELEQLKARDDAYKYIFPIAYPTGKKYYQLASWNSVVQSKWFDLANEIPSFKLAMMKNQITLKYVITIPNYYWNWKYKDWETYDQKKRVDLRQEEYKKATEILQGSENSGKVLFNSSKWDEIAQKELPGWKIEPIDDRQKDSIWIEDSLEATIKIWTALGVDPSLAGISPGKGKLNTSGSNIREAFNVYLSLQKSVEEEILAPYDLISEYNGWIQKYGQMKWFFKKPFLQTLDNVTPSQRDTTTEE